MKFTHVITVLAVVQTALILLLVVKFQVLEDQGAEIAASLESLVPTAATPSTKSPVRQAGGMDSKELRRIIREELQAFQVQAVTVASGANETDEPVIDEAEMAYQRDLVIQEMEYLKQQDQVSTSELDRLISDIAHLDPESRSEMMKELNRAMNSGEIKGRL